MQIRESTRLNADFSCVRARPYYRASQVPTFYLGHRPICKAAKCIDCDSQSITINLGEVQCSTRRPRRLRVTYRCVGCEFPVSLKFCRTQKQCQTLHRQGIFHLLRFSTNEKCRLFNYREFITLSVSSTLVDINSCNTMRDGN